MNRNLDGCFFRIQREGVWQNICFSDLSAEERIEMMKDKDAEWLKSLCQHLADRLAVIGEQFNLEGEVVE